MLSDEEITRHTNAFWVSLARQWEIIYRALMYGNDNDRTNSLNLINFFAGPLVDHLDFELTVGEFNRVPFEQAENQIELYISPKLLQVNVPIMEKLYNKAIPLPNLSVFKYRSYNPKDPLISMIEYKTDKFSYDEFGCQSFHILDDTKPIINIVIYVKKAAAEKLLRKKKVTFADSEKKDLQIEKWLPVGTNVIDILLVNIIGEYNLIHNVGYIEFLPEGDPLIAGGSVFTELGDLRAEFASLDRQHRTQHCLTCGRSQYQTMLSRCTVCGTAYYCGKMCQRIDWPVHKKICKK